MTLLSHRDFCTTLVLTLGHFLWQGTTAAVITQLVARRCTSAHARYQVFVVGLLVMTICVPSTLLLVRSSRSTAVSHDAAKAAPSVGDPGLDASGKPATAWHSIPTGLPPVPAATTPPAAEVGAAWARFIPFLAEAYLLVVLLMLLRLMTGLWGGWRLRRSARAVEQVMLVDALARQAGRLRMKAVPWLAYCEEVTLPTVIGVIKPTILLPLTITSGLSPEQVESVLAHELAHLKRYDHLVNLLQRVIESLLFFHPAVWWISHRIRTEREQCCDDLVVACGASPVDYATSLLRVAEWSVRPRPRTSLAALSLLATDGEPSTLRRRIARLLGDTAEPTVRLCHRWPVVVVVAASLAMILALYRFGGQSIAADLEPADTALIAEWVAVVDADVLAELKKLKMKPGDVPQGNGYESFRWSADELRAALKPYLGRKKKLDIPRALRFMEPPPPDYRTSGLAYTSIASWMQPSDAPRPGAASWPYPTIFIDLSVAGTYFCAAKQDGVSLRIAFNSLHAHLGNWQSNVKLKFETNLQNDEALTTIFHAEPVGDWNPSMLLVHEVVRMAEDDALIYQQLDRLEDWIRFGRAGQASDVARIQKWRRQPQQLLSQVDPKWTRQVLKHGGKIELVALSQPRIAPDICWTPSGQAIDPKPFVFANSECENDELVAIVRVWEPGRQRSSRKWDATESTDAPGAQFTILQGVDGNKFKVGAGFGPWTNEADMAAKEEAAAMTGEAEFRISAIQYHGTKVCVFIHPRRSSAQTIRDLWLVAITKSGKSIEPNASTEPQVNMDDKNQLPAAFWFDLAVADIDHFVLKSRPIQWVEFAGFQSAPPIAKPLSESRH